MKKNWLFIAVMGGLLGFAIWPFSNTPTDRVETIRRLLSTIPKSQLVLTTEEFIAETSYDQSSFLLGRRFGRAWIVVRKNWGVDLDKLASADITGSGNQIVVKLPKIELLEVIPDMGSWLCISKRSGLQALRDVFLEQSIESELVHLAASDCRNTQIADKPPREKLIEHFNQVTRKYLSDSQVSITFE